MNGSGSDLIEAAEEAAAVVGDWLLAPERQYGKVVKFSAQTKTMRIDGADIEVEWNFHHNTMDICTTAGDSVRYTNVVFRGAKGLTHHPSTEVLCRMGFAVRSEA